MSEKYEPLDRTLKLWHCLTCSAVVRSMSSHDDWHALLRGAIADSVRIADRPNPYRPGRR